MPRDPAAEPCLHDRVWYYCIAQAAHKTRRVIWTPVENGCKAKKHRDVTKIPMIERNFRGDRYTCPDCDNAIYDAALNNALYGFVPSPSCSSASSVTGRTTPFGPAGGRGAGPSTSAGNVAGGGTSGGFIRSDSGGGNSSSGHTRSGGGASTSSNDRRAQAAALARRNTAVYYGTSSSDDFANVRGGSEGSGHGSKYNSDAERIWSERAAQQNSSSSESRH